jgi:hypothetical protein
LVSRVSFGRVGTVGDESPEVFGVGTLTSPPCVGGVWTRVSGTGTCDEEGVLDADADAEANVDADAGKGT